MKNLTKEIIRNAKPGSAIEWWAKDDQNGDGWKGSIEFPYNYNGDIRTANRPGDFWDLTNYSQINYQEDLQWYDNNTGLKHPIYCGELGSCPFSIYTIIYYPKENPLDAPIKKELAVESLDAVNSWIKQKLNSEMLHREPEILGPY